MRRSPSASDVQATFAATLVDEWVRSGVTDAVVAPGSRSTPLLVALGDDRRIATHVALDERAAGFMALGYGMATGRPAPVVTTSGTAAVELHPAVVEADLAGVAMVAVTADRPPELHHVGAPQTVEQVGLYGGATRLVLDPGAPTADGAGGWRALAARAVAAARGGPLGPGPVQLNLAFREPLLGQPGALPEGRPDGAPWTLPSTPVPGPVDDAVLGRLVERRAEAGVIVAGAGAGDPAVVLDVASALGWPVFADPRSGVRLPHHLVVAAADALLRTDVAGWEPQAVLRLGRPWASKVLGSWLAQRGPGAVDVLVDPHGRWADPDRRVTHVIAADPTGVGLALQARAGAGGHVASRWAARWHRAEAAAQVAIGGVLTPEAEGRAPLSEPGVARAVTAAVPDGGVLVVSSSMPVRDVEWFSAPRRGIRVLANRGANGIDGVVATCVGAALSGTPTVGLLGDLAFVYDASALLWAARRPVRCTLVVVDNDGGGIFSFLPQAGMAPGRFEEMWGTPHGLDVVAVCRAYGVAVAEVASGPDLLAAVGDPGPGVRVVVVRTDRHANVAAHERVNAAVAAAVAGL
ncbi:MAG TPA: 2-succinyl-5-enolpyruvyl-6-hydroxy-3-cyclohexene-1-carboxylic-acid synthase [Acidimicrobiales bacterium]|nr:2-succinyl-5-enolpyruvyl-6-hydroxy-3-cyclohexene-1-carboxylic-acid synthase [Acidimicrobiales bacterium]